jgi:hypothetical protein
VCVRARHRPPAPALPPLTRRAAAALRHAQAEREACRAVRPRVPLGAAAPAAAPPLPTAQRRATPPLATTCVPARTHPRPQPPACALHARAARRRRARWPLICPRCAAAPLLTPRAPHLPTCPPPQPPSAAPCPPRQHDRRRAARGASAARRAQRQRHATRRRRRHRRGAATATATHRRGGGGCGGHRSAVDRDAITVIRRRP